MQKPQCEYASAGGSGGAAHLLEAQSGRKSASLNLIGRAVRNRWGVQDAFKAEIPVFLNQVINSPESEMKDRLKASEILRAMERDNVDAAMGLDKIDRLDAGKSTEIVEERRVRLAFDRSG